MSLTEGYRDKHGGGGGGGGGGAALEGPSFGKLRNRALIAKFTRACGLKCRVTECRLAFSHMRHNA